MVHTEAMQDTPATVTAGAIRKDPAAPLVRGPVAAGVLIAFALADTRNVGSLEIEHRFLRAGFPGGAGSGRVHSRPRCS